jgi:hypothetical protein
MRSMGHHTSSRENGTGFPAAFAAGLVLVLIVAACVVLVSRHSKSSQPVAHSAKLPFGPAEQAYAPNIQFDNIKLARATNLLGEEFTYVDVSLKNSGTQSIHGLSISLEFYDPFKQVVLRDTETLIGAADPSLDPGKQRDLRITLGQVPPEWNHETPVFRVTGLVLK